MKKVLLATTALVLSAGFAAAEVKLSGSANMGLKYDEGGLSYAPAKKAAGWYEIDIDVVGTMESDSGLTFGASVDLDSDYSSALKGTTQKAIDGEVFVSGAFGTFTIGNTSTASDDLGISDIGFDGIGVDDLAETSMYADTANEDFTDARWDYTVGAFGAVVTVDTISDDYSLGGSYDFGTVKIAAAYDYTDATDVHTTSVLLTGSVDAFSGELYVADASDARGTSWGIYGSYKTGALTLEAAYADADGAADAAYGIGAKYDLGGGAKLAGGLGSVSDDMVADFGVTFKF